LAGESSLAANCELKYMDYLAQITLFAQNGDDGNWMQMLIFVGIAVFYVIAGVVRKFSENKIKLDEEEQPRRLTQSKRPRGRFIPFELVSQMFDNEVEEPIQSPAPEAPQPSESQPQPELEDKRVVVSSQTTEPADVIEPLLDLGDADKLTMAILHYEILGKPVSLRGPSEHIIGLRVNYSN